MEVGRLGWVSKCYMLEKGTHKGPGFEKVSTKNYKQPDMMVHAFISTQLYGNLRLA